MELLHLKYFKKVAEQQHITKVANEIMIAQPALSKIIKNLENEVGVPLFDRRGKSLHLNDNGKIMLKYTNKIFENLDNMITEIQDNHENDLSVVRVSMTAATSVTPDFLLEFHKNYPYIKIMMVQDLEEENTAEATDVFISSSREKINNADTRTLLVEKCFIGLPTNHKFAERDEIELEELSNENFLLLLRNRPLGQMTKEYCRNAGFDANIVLECNNHETLIAFISIGIGIAFIPAITWGTFPKYPIKRIKVKNIDCKRYINISWNKNKYMTKATKAFIEFAVDYFNNLQEKAKKQ